MKHEISIDEVLSHARNYERISVAVAKGDLVFDAASGKVFIGDALIVRGDMQIRMTPTEETAVTSGDFLEVLREILRVPEGENILTHAKAVRELADTLLVVMGQK